MKPWDLRPTDRVTVYWRGNPIASATISYCGHWLRVDGLGRVRMDRLGEYTPGRELRLIPRQNPDPFSEDERQRFFFES